MEQKQNRSSFSGKIGFVLSAAGASVGLGNIWRFPYLAAKYGGGIFLLIYIVLALTFGYSMIMAETALGRMTGKSPVGAYASFAGKGRKNGFLGFGGWINAIIPVPVSYTHLFWTLSARPMSPRVRPAASRRPSVRIRSRATTASLPSSTPRATRPSPRCVPAART